jgi:hypothetical protein
MEVGELLDEAFDFYKRNFLLFFSIVVVLIVPTTLLQIALSSPERDPWLAVALPLPSTMLVACALTRAAMDRLLGRETTLIAAYGQALRRFLWLMLVTLVYGLAAIIGLFFFFIPGLVVGLWSMLLPPVVMLENRGLGVISRPIRLAGGEVWRLFILGFALLAVLLVYTGVLLSLAALIYPLTGTKPLIPPDRSNQVATLTYAAVLLVDAVIRSAWVPIVWIVQLMAYLDLRIRREAYDLELLTAAVEARAAARRTSGEVMR